MGTGSGMRDRRQWRLMSLLVFVVTLGSVFATLDDPGLTWDEPFSILAGSQYAEWLGRLPSLPFGREDVDRYWGFNHEHPPLAKVLMGMSQGIGAHAVLSSRMAVALLFALLVEVVFVFAARAFGRLAGIGAAVSLLCMPRVFGHAHLAALDVPLAFTWTLSVVVFARAVEKGGWRRGVVSGLCLGLALLTKLPAVLLPLGLAVWGVGVHRKRALAPLAWTFGIGVVTFFLFWPWMWYDTVHRLRDYLFPTTRVPIFVTYFGTGEPAWHYALVMTVVTLPLGILAAVVLGTGSALRRFRADPKLALVMVSVVLVLGAFSTPWLPCYDGVRLLLPAFPFVAILAGVGVQRVWEWIVRNAPRRRRQARMLAGVVVLCLVGAMALVHPYYLSYYNGLVGGLWGAEKLGLEATYWHDVVDRPLMEWLNTHCRVGSRIAFYPVGEFVVSSAPKAPDMYEMFYLNQQKALRAVRLEKGTRYDYLVLNARTAYLERHEEAKRVWETGIPLYEVKRQGVRLAAVFRRR